MVQADHTYQGHPLENVISRVTQRGAGIELRLHGCDPDAAEAAARQFGYAVLVGAMNAREMHLSERPTPHQTPGACAQRLLPVERAGPLFRCPTIHRAPAAPARRSNPPWPVPPHSRSCFSTYG